MATNIDLETEITQLKVRLFKSEVKFEALIRWLFSKGTLNSDDYLAAITNFQVFNNTLGQINAIPSIMDKVHAATEFNKTSIIKISADDLGIKKIIEDAGGTSDFTARLILLKIPCSPSFKEFITQFFDVTKNPSPEALIPDQVS